jgi:class 3 adenylate cyclase/tetratricopeptide (TPR) repeat protein
MTGISVFLPKNILKLLSQKKRFAIKEGFVLFCDIAGFTPLTETLSRMGKEGSERLTFILNNYFTEMIEIVYSFKGDVLRFGGDAMTLFFEKELEKNSLKCAKEMMKRMENFKDIKEGENIFSLSMKIGISSGNVLFGIIGEKEGFYDYFCAGIPLDESAESEHKAEKGEIVLHPKIVESFKDFVMMKEDNFGKLDPSKEITAEPEKNKELETYEIETFCEGLFPQYLLERAGEGIIGEHRATSVIFLGFSGIAIPSSELEYKNFYKKIDSIYNFFVETSKNYGGTLNKIDMGDKGMKAIFLFGSPFAIEKKEEMALRCALDLIENNPFKGEVDFKMGITTAALFTGAVGSPKRREFTVMGDGINTSARLMQNAPPSAIFTDETTYSSTKDDFEFTKMAPLMLKGKKEKTEVYKLDSLKSKESFKESTFLIERESILAKVKNLLMTEGEPILITGGAGVGKTEIIEWARIQCDALKIPNTRIFLAPYHKNRPYSLWKGAIRSLIGVKKEDKDEIVEKLLKESLKEFDSESLSPLLNEVVGIKASENDSTRNLSPKDRKDIAFALIEKLFSNCDERVLLADNIDNLDPLSLELLNFILQGKENKNFKIVASARESNQDLERVLSNFIKENLNPLSFEGTKSFLKRILNLVSISESAADFLYKKSAGIPKFLLAFIDSLQREGIILKEEAGFYIDEDKLFKTPFPDKIEDLFLQKVDRLGKEEREVVQISSVLGYSISLYFLSYISKKEVERLKKIIDSLVEKEIFFYDTWGERPYFKFKDNLLRDAVYDSLSFSLKREIHLKCAQFLEKECGENSRVWSIIAEHYKGAKEEIKANNYFKRCAYDSLSRYDNVSAFRFLEEVCKAGVTKENLDCGFALIEVYGNLGKNREEFELIEKIEKLENNLTQKEKLRLLSFQAKKAIVERDGDKAEEIFYTTEEIAKKEGDILSLAKVYVNRAGALYGPRGELKKASESLDKCLSLKEKREIAVLKITALFNKGIILKQEGKYDEALNYFKTAYRRSSRLNLLPQMAIISGNIARQYFDQFDYRDALLWAKRTQKNAEILSLRSILVLNEHFISIVENILGKIEEAKKRLTLNFENCKRFNNFYALSLCYQALIDVNSSVLELKSAINQGLNSIKTSIQLKDSITYKETLVEFLKLFYSYDERIEPKQILKNSEIMNFYKDCQKNPQLDLLIDELLNWIEGKTIQFKEEVYNTILERLKGDYLFICLEESIKRKNHSESKDLLNKLFLDEKNFTTIHNKVKLFLFLSILEDKRADIFEKEVLRNLKRYLYGIYGLRAIYYFCKKEKSRAEKKRLRKLFISRIYYFKINSPEWAFKKLLQFEEIEKIFRGM